MAEPDLVSFHSQVHHFIPLQLLSAAYFSIQTMSQISTIQICYDTPMSLRVPFINGAHLQVRTVCCSHLIHFLYLTVLIFYTNYK